jgi:hypothetical protein
MTQAPRHTAENRRDVIVIQSASKEISHVCRMLMRRIDYNPAINDKEDA